MRPLSPPENSSHSDGMAAALPLKEQIEAASRMALRCHTHLALWRVTAMAQGRERHRVVLDDHWEHLRFLQHGQLVTALLELHSLLDAHESTINLPHLVAALEEQKGSLPLLRDALASTRNQFAKVRLLRNSVFAHRTRKKSYNDVFTSAAITPDRLQELVVTCIKIANELRVEIGLVDEAPSPLPVEYYERMLRQLANISPVN